MTKKGIRTALLAEVEDEVPPRRRLARGRVGGGVDVQVESADEDAAGDALDEGGFEGFWEDWRGVVR